VQIYVFDRSGMKLLGKGQVVRSLAQLERLLEIGLWGEADVVEALRASRDSSTQRTSIALTFYQVSAFDQLRALRLDLHSLLAPWDATPASATRASIERVRTLAERLMHAVELDPDAAIATIAWLRERPYAARQAVNTAVVADLLLAHLGADRALRCSAVCAALTMNLSIHSLQDVLYEVKTPTPEQQALIQTHPLRSSSMLAAAGAGTADQGWLEAVLQHHESADGSGYPSRFAGSQVDLAARAIGVADRFCAVVSERTYRSALPAGIALSKMFNGSSPAMDTSMVATLNRVMGAWPPGTVVMLRSAELAVVTHRTSDPRGPIARSVRTRDGVASASCPKRPTQRETFAIVEESGPDRLPQALDVASLWNVALEARPA